MLRKYESLVQRLSNTEKLDELSDARLSSFKRIYGTSAFPCRTRGCPRSSHGFGNEIERLEHEKTHSLNLYCNDLSCEYNKLGFTTARALKKHTLECHSPLQRKAPGALRKDLELVRSVETPHSDTEESTDDDEDTLVDSLGFPTELVPARRHTELTLETEDSFALSTTSWHDTDT